MCIKFKFSIYFFTLILVTFFNVCNNGIEASEDTRDGRTCSSKESISLNTTYNEDSQYQYTDSKKTKISQRLQSIISDIISKGSHEETKNHDELKNIFPNTEDTLSLRKQDVEIFATIMDEDTTVPVVTTFPTQSSSSSSQFDSNKFDSNKNVSDDSNGGDESDLNKTETLTFHYKKETAQSDKLEASNTTEQITVTFQSPEAPKVVNDTGSITDREDIPSFREWTEKHLAEEEKERGDDNNTNVPTNGKRPKVRNKNYASLDCGAKLIATNPEAKSAGSLLSTNRDEYLLSACNSKIWFVVELCETVQLKKIDLANFELFSSSPKEFSVLISDRFPSRDWTVVGQFIAKDEKSIQSFNLQPHHFTKYIKVEFHSHYGKEHFCPLSLFKVYGTSEFEVLENVDGNDELENDATESDDDINEPIMSDEDNKTKKMEPTNNLFGSARDAVMNIVKKAAEALVKTPSQHQNSFNFTPTVIQNRSRYAIIRDCITPKYSVLCKHCSEEFFNKVYMLVSCYMKELHQLLQVDVIWKPLMKYNVCVSFGIPSLYAKFSMNFTRSNDFYALRLLPKDMLAAFCNLIAVSEYKSKENITGDELFSLNRTSKKCDKPTLVESIHQSVSPDNEMTLASQSASVPFKIVEYTTFTDESYDGHTLMSQIKPTKTLPPDSDAPFVLNNPAIATAIPNIAVFSEIPETETKAPIHEDNEPVKDTEHSVEIIEDSSSLDSLISELEKSEDSQHGASASQQTSTPKPHPQKESVFVRLANRIKALERNMSLSGQYLEELSKRYKKQIEEAAEDRQKNLERESRRSQEINLLSQHIAELTVAVDALIAERDSWSYKAIMVGEHSLIIFVEIVIFIGIVCLCRGIPRVEISKRKFSLEWRRNKPPQDGENTTGDVAKRRQSLDDININRPSRTQKRRPSEEALKIDGSTHQDLLIHESNRTSKSENRRKRRKRKELLLKSNANAINLETGDIMSRRNHVNKITNAPLSRSASASEIDEHSWGRIDYTKNHTGGRDIIDALRQDENKYPPFFKTATSVRNKRLSGQLNGVSNLSPVYDVSSDQDSSQPSTPVKGKKVNGIKKIVRRFF